MRHVPQNVKFTMAFYFHPEICFIGPKCLSRIASLIQFSTNENSLLPMHVVAVCYDLSAIKEQFHPLTTAALPSRHTTMQITRWAHGHNKTDFRICV